MSSLYRFRLMCFIFLFLFFFVNCDDFERNHGETHQKSFCNILEYPKKKIELPEFSELVYEKCRGEANFSAFIDDSGVLKIDCPANKKPFYKLDHNAQKESLHPSDHIQVDHPYIYAFCDKEEKLLTNLIKLTNENNGKNKGFTRPVALVMLDATARHHFMRSLPKTIQTLKSSKSHVVDFKMLNTEEYNSVPSQLLLLTGNTEPPTLDDSLFQIARDFGYVTAFGEDSCGGEKKKTFGFKNDSQPTDYEWNSIHCEPKYTNEMGWVNYNEHCILGKPAHRHLMEYSTKMIKKHHNESYFFFINFHVAHEWSMKNLQSIDEDLSNYMTIIIKNIVEEQQGIVILMSDHGIHYGPWFTGSSVGNLEHDNPALYLVVPQNAVKTWAPHLDENSQRLTTMNDLYTSIVSFFNEEKGKEMKVKFPFSTNIFKERIPWWRSCVTAHVHTALAPSNMWNIANDFCSCRVDYTDCMPDPNIDSISFYDRCMNIYTHPLVFDWKFYVETNQDLFDDDVDECKAKRNWCREGLAQMRQAHEHFNILDYININNEESCFQSNLNCNIGNVIVHYLEEGYYKGLKAIA